MRDGNNYGATVHNQAHSDPTQPPVPPEAAPQPSAEPSFPFTAGPDAAPQPPFPPQFAPASPQPPYPFGSDLPPQPYGDPAAYGQHPGHPQAPAMLPGTNGFAIGALVASICGGLGLGSLLGLAFGIAALVQLKRRPQKGRGLAVAAVVISGLTLVATIAILGVALVEAVRDRAAGIDDVAVYDLQTGQCIRDLDASTAVADLPTVPCSQPHTAEVYHVFTLPAGPFPGPAEVETKSDEICGTAFEPYATPQNENMDIYYLYPTTPIDWRRDRGVTCIAVDPAGTRTTSLIK